MVGLQSYKFMKLTKKDKNDKNDWRLHGQEKYLKGVRLKWGTWRKPKPSWDHDHCVFCWIRFCGHKDDAEAIQQGYTTLDEYHWICKECFEDFKIRFAWKISK